jgi:hypothetical protein
MDPGMQENFLYWPSCYGHCPFHNQGFQDLMTTPLSTLAALQSVLSTAAGAMVKIKVKPSCSCVQNLPVGRSQDLLETHRGLYVLLLPL